MRIYILYMYTYVYFPSICNAVLQELLVPTFEPSPLHSLLFSSPLIFVHNRESGTLIFSI